MRGSIDLFLCEWSKLTWFLYAGRKSLDFSVGIKIDLAFVWVIESDLISVPEMETFLITAYCSKLTWSKTTCFRPGGSNLTRFLCQIEIHLMLESGSKLT